MTAKTPPINQHHRAARVALQQGQLREAHQHCLAILKLDQAHADAWFICGVIAAQNGQLAKSVDILRRATELACDSAEYRAELGKQLLALHEPLKALRVADEALALEPGELPTLNTLGAVFSHVGEHEKALACYERAAITLQERPAGESRLSTQWQADLYCNMGISLQFAGRFDRAEQAFEQAIGLRPSLYKAHAALSQLQRQTPDSNHLDRLKDLCGHTSTPREQLLLGHAIAKEQEDLEQYEDSLASLAWAKLGQAAKVGYQAETDAALLATIERLFNAKLFSTKATNQQGCDNPEPIFIVGMPRTGTTLVEQILSSHSQVYAAGELQNFSLQVKRMTGSASTDMLDTEVLSQSLHLDMSKLGSDYIDSTRPRTGHTPHFIDKLPMNFLYLGLIKLALPNAKLICLRRDPMDTCLSNYRQLFATNFKPYYYNLNLIDCGRYYIQFDRLMRHWREVMPGGVFELHYEALVDEPEKVSREVLAHCGLPWEDQCLEFNRRKTSVATASAVQVRNAIYQSSVNRWQRFGDTMQPLYELLKSAGYYQ
jgi:tetratricopeptide (TPR) repeat protein